MRLLMRRVKLIEASFVLIAHGTAIPSGLIAAAAAKSAQISYLKKVAIHAEQVSPSPYLNIRHLAFIYYGFPIEA